MRKHILTGLAVALALLAGPVAVAQTQGSDNRRPQKPIALPIPKGTPTRPTGMAALPGDNPRAFTAEAMTAYFREHNLPMSLGKASDIHVDKVELLADKDLAARLDGESTGLGPDERVALVTLRGRFLFSGPPGGSPGRALAAYAVFDAKDGNLLMVGTLNDPLR